MDALAIAKDLLRSALQLGARADQLERDTPLLGNFAEFNSLTVVGLITGVEEQTGAVVADDEISADIFQTVGSFADFIAQKLA
jgi:acyl carrier protein